MNDFVAAAFTTGSIYIKSDGTPWRPLVHVEDICQAFITTLEAPREVVHNQSLNVGSTSENYRVRELAQIVAEIVPGSRIEYAPGGGPDQRCYRVDCDKIRRLVPRFNPTWDVRSGVEQLYRAYQTAPLKREDVEGSSFIRLQALQQAMSSGRIDDDLRFVANSAKSSETATSCTTTRR